MDDEIYIRELINRLARLDTSSAWKGDLNPAQRAVLRYLARANRFSRSPSQVAEYLGSTRGTVSQTFKSLLRKGYVSDDKSQVDKRIISFDLTEKGALAVRELNPFSQVIEKLDDATKETLTIALEALMLQVLEGNGGRAFGICCRCRHFAKVQDKGRCMLLGENLTRSETLEICHEQEAA